MLVKYALQNGPSFLGLMREKQAADPKFSFLFGGEGSAYFQWSLWTGAHSGVPPPDQRAAQPLAPAPAAATYAAPAPWAQPQQLQAAPAPLLAPRSPDLPEEVAVSFGMVLDMLSGSKDSIKSSQQWFMKCLPYASGLARAMARRVVALTDYDRQLHLIYLANDILFKSLTLRVTDSSASVVAPAFQPVMPALLAAAFNQGGRTEEVKSRLHKILTFWSERCVFDAASIVHMEAAMTATHDPASLLEQCLAAADAQQAAAQHQAAQQAALLAAQQAAAARQAAAAQHAAVASHAAAVPVAGAGSAWGPQMGAGAPVQAQAGGAYQYGQPSVGAQALQHQAPPPPPQQPQYPGYQAGGPTPPGVAPWQATPAPWAQQQQPQQPPPPPWGTVAGQLAAPPYGQAGPAAGPGPGGHWPGGPPPPAHQQHYMPPGQQQMPPPPPGYGAGGAALQHTAPPGWYPPPGAQPSTSTPPPMYQQQQQQQQQQLQLVGQPPGSYPAPPSYGQQQQQQQQQQQMPPPPAAPQPEPVSSFNFPPGLLPKLLKQKAQHSARYSPLEQEDIEAEGLPPPPEKTTYLLSRMEKFYADIRDYRPGLSVVDMLPPGDPLLGKGAAARSHHRDHTNDSHPGGRGRAGFSDGGVPTMAADGSFPSRGGGRGRGRGAQESQHAGLGSHVYHRSRTDDSDVAPAGLGSAAAASAPTPAPAAKVLGAGDMYSTYRKARSGVYHDTIVRGPFTAPTRPRQ